MFVPATQYAPPPLPPSIPRPPPPPQPMHPLVTIPMANVNSLDNVQFTPFPFMRQPPVSQFPIGNNIGCSNFFNPNQPPPHCINTQPNVTHNVSTAHVPYLQGQSMHPVQHRIDPRLIRRPESRQPAPVQQPQRPQIAHQPVLVTQTRKQPVGIVAAPISKRRISLAAYRARVQTDGDDENSMTLGTAETVRNNGEQTSGSKPVEVNRATRNTKLVENNVETNGSKASSTNEIRNDDKENSSSEPVFSPAVCSERHSPVYSPESYQSEEVDENEIEQSNDADSRQSHDIDTQPTASVNAPTNYDSDASTDSNATLPFEWDDYKREHQHEWDAPSQEQDDGTTKIVDGEFQLISY